MHSVFTKKLAADLSYEATVIYRMIFFFFFWLLLLLIYKTKQVKNVGEAGEYSGDLFGSTCKEIKW